MKKVLVYTTGYQGAQESLQIDQAIEEASKGNEVFFLHCDEKIGFCNNNSFGNPIKCNSCLFFQSAYRRRYLPSTVKVISIKDVLTPDIIQEGEKIYEYTSSDELRNIEYHGIEIGMGVLSTYISLTRNLAPLIDENSKKYFDKLLKGQIILTRILETLHDKYQFDKIIFHNGRFAQYKPLLNFAQKKHIDFICTESWRDREGRIKKNYFINSIPHDMNKVGDRILKEWEKSPLALSERIRIGTEFYTRKRDSKNTGDKVYTINQQRGFKISSWDKTKENIVIFNSSEDEFSAISKEFDSKKLFKNQIEGIKEILNHYAGDSKKHFYLRIHPNLTEVKYKFHTDLLLLNYPNLTVISAASPVDTYELINKADKVIVFGSTVGIESTFSKKPVICLGPASYSDLNVVYIPKSKSELWKLIDRTGLPHKFNDNVLKYGFYQMAAYYSLIGEECKNINNKPYRIKLFNKSAECFAYEKVLGSNLLFIFTRSVLYRLNNIYKKIFRIQPLPSKEE